MARGDRWREAFPLPLVAIAVLLLALIAITPNLVSNGKPAAGSLESTAELLVDHPGDQNATSFYVHGVGTVRYDNITISLGGNVSWPPPSSYSSLKYRDHLAWNETVAGVASTPLNPVAVRVTALYTDTTGATALFEGIYVFDVSSGALQYETYLPGPPSSATSSLGDLPINLLLNLAPSGSAV